MTEFKDDTLNGLMEHITRVVNDKDLELEVLNGTVSTLRDMVSDEKAKAEEAYKTAYKIHKQIKSLSILLSKDSLKKMNEEELRDVIETAKSMVFSSRNILSRYLQENGYQ